MSTVALFSHQVGEKLAAKFIWIYTDSKIAKIAEYMSCSKDSSKMPQDLGLYTRVHILACQCFYHPGVYMHLHSSQVSPGTVSFPCGCLLRWPLYMGNMNWIPACLISFCFSQWECPSCPWRKGAVSHALLHFFTPFFQHCLGVTVAYDLFPRCRAMSHYPNTSFHVSFGDDSRGF